MSKPDNRNSEICEREGHDFGPWKYFSEEIWIDHQFVRGGNYSGWYRTCTRCDKSEWSKDEPKEVSEQKKEGK